MEQILDGSLPEADDGYMADLYAQMLLEGAATFGALLTHLTDDDGLPALFHCTAGKDRTGIAAALLLSVLGVEDATILDDYELTNIYRSNRRIDELRPSIEAAGVDVEKVRPFLSARRPVMEATLRHLHDDHGGVEGYLLGPAGMAPETLDRLRDLLLEQVDGSGEDRAVPGGQPTASDFDEGFAAAAGSVALREVLRAGFPDLPWWMETYDLVPFSALEHIAELLGDLSGRRLLDLACGLGGPGIHLAERTGALLCGVDWSRVGARVATTTARSRLPDRAAYAVGAGDRLPLRDGSMDAAVCIDALTFLPGLGIAELVRVLRPGATLAITAWERDRATGDRPVVPSFADALSAAGFDIVAREEHPEWLAMQDAAYRAAIERHELEPGEPAVAAFAEEARAMLASGDAPRRVLVVGVRATRRA
jgi:SAM-dependent methyltransferase